MKKLLTLIIIAAANLSLLSAVRSEEILKKDNNKYLGWEYRDRFKTCSGTLMSKTGGQILPTVITCPDDGPPGPTVSAEIAGTVVSTDNTNQTLTVKDTAGQEHQIFVPTSEKSKTADLKVGSDVTVGTSSGDTAEGNRVEGVDVR
jgi:hypothetical protein